MSSKSTLSYTGAVILQAIANGYRYGFDIMDITGLPSGTVYPALRRMEQSELVESSWETEGEAQAEGRPSRKYYEVTDTGGEVLAEAIKRYRFLDRLMPQSARKVRTEP
jgi:PadR family transcriptional regulator, regulatory protein PadR